MRLLAVLIAKEEGFFRSGSLPARRHNPGDLRHSPHSSHAGLPPDAIGMIDTDRHGWEDLERQLDLDAARGMSLAQFVDSYAPSEENDTAQYLRYLTEGLGVAATTKLSDALKIV